MSYKNKRLVIDDGKDTECKKIFLLLNEVGEVVQLRNAVISLNSSLRIKQYWKTACWCADFHDPESVRTNKQVYYIVS